MPMIKRRTKTMMALTYHHQWAVAMMKILIARIKTKMKYHQFSHHIVGQYPGCHRTKQKKKHKAVVCIKWCTEGTAHINLKNRTATKMIEEEVKEHVMGVIFQ